VYDTHSTPKCPMQVTDELSRDLHEQIGNAAMVELTATIAWENDRARFHHVLGATERGFAEGMG